MMQEKSGLLPESLMESSLQQEELSQQVESYHLKRLVRLTTLLLITVGTLTIVIAGLHLSLSRKKAQLEHTHAGLTTTHKRHAQTWHTRSVSAKKLNALKSNTLNTSPAPLLKKIAEVIPPITLLTRFSATKNTITLTGYASTTEELSEFMIGLSTTGLTKITLPTSRKEPSGIYFVINSCSENFR